MMYVDGHAGGGTLVAMSIFMSLFWGSTVALLWLGGRTLLERLPRPVSTLRPDPRDVLDERLARGQVDPEDFEHRPELCGGPR